MSGADQPFVLNCLHGIHPSQPCASCGRPYQPPAEYHVAAPDMTPIVAAINRLAKAMERLAHVEEERSDRGR